MPLIGRSRAPARSGPGPGSRKSERQENARNAVPVRAVEKAEGRKTRVTRSRSGQ